MKFQIEENPNLVFINISDKYYCIYNTIIGKYLFQFWPTKKNIKIVYYLLLFL